MEDQLSKTEIIDAVQRAVSRKDLTDQAAEIVKKAADVVLQRYGQEIQVGIGEKVTPIVQQFTRELAESLDRQATNWSDSSEQLLIYPEGTRFIHRKNGGMTIVIEVKPHVRTFRFIGHGRDHYRLALPYTVFMVHFQGNRWAGGQVAWRKKPLRTLDDNLYYTGLPNMNENYSPCMGGHFTIDVERSITEQAEEFVAQWFEFGFNTDITTHLSDFLQRNASTCDCLEDWEKESKTNSLFILTSNMAEGANTLRHCLYQGNNNGPASFLDEVKGKINQAVGNIGNVVQDYLKSSNPAAQNRKRIHQDDLQNVLREIIVQAYAELCEYNEAVLEKERRKMRRELEQAVRDDLSGILESRWKKNNPW